MHDLTHDDRAQLARLIVTLLDSWKVSAENQIALMGAIWMNRRNNRFDNRAPLAVLLEDGLAGFFAIRTH